MVPVSHCWAPCSNKKIPKCTTVLNALMLYSKMSMCYVKMNISNSIHLYNEQEKPDYVLQNYFFLVFLCTRSKHFTLEHYSL